jgi:hypothetical protein
MFNQVLLCFSFFRRSPSSVNFHLIFGELLTDTLKAAIIDELERHAPRHVIDRKEMFEVGDLMLIAKSCNVSLHPVNYTHTDPSIIPSIKPTQTAGVSPSLSKSFLFTVISPVQ